MLGSFGRTGALVALGVVAAAACGGGGHSVAQVRHAATTTTLTPPDTSGAHVVPPPVDPCSLVSAKQEIPEGQAQCNWSVHKGNTYVKISLGGSGYGSNRRPWVLDTDDKRAAFIALGKAAVDRL